jgi:hypothetical protein
MRNTGTDGTPSSAGIFAFAAFFGLGVGLLPPRHIQPGDRLKQKQYKSPNSCPCIMDKFMAYLSLLLLWLLMRLRLLLLQARE